MTCPHRPPDLDYDLDSIAWGHDVVQSVAHLLGGQLSHCVSDHVGDHVEVLSQGPVRNHGYRSKAPGPLK